MATYTSNYGWTKPSGSDNVNIGVLNANLDSQDSIMHDAFTNMAQAFSESSTYEVGDIVVYGTTTYKCHTAVTTAGSWTGSTNWQVYKLSEGGSGGLTLGETSSTAYRGDRGKAAYDHSQTTGNPHGTTAADVGLGNVPNVTTNDQEPTFTEASTRNNIASGEKLSVIFGKIAKFFNDLKTVAFSGSYNDLTDKPSAEDILMSDNATSVEDAIDALDTGVGTLGDKLVTVTADGIKTYSQLLDQLFPYRNRLYRIEIDSTMFYPSTATRYGHVGGTSNGDVNIRSIGIKGTDSTYKSITIASSTGAVSTADLSSSVPDNGVKIKLVKSFMS